MRDSMQKCNVLCCKSTRLAGIDTDDSNGRGFAVDDDMRGTTNALCYHIFRRREVKLKFVIDIDDLLGGIQNVARLRYAGR